MSLRPTLRREERREDEVVRLVFLFGMCITGNMVSIENEDEVEDGKLTSLIARLRQMIL